MSKKINSKIIIGIIVLLIVALISMFVIAPLASSTSFHSKTIKSLDDKKMTVVELTVAAAGASTALAAVPGDATTPLANQVLSLSSYLLIIIGAIFLEKMLLTLTGYITFKLLIPIACLLYGIYLFIQNDSLKKISIKLIIFGLIIFTVIPLSIKLSNLIETTYQSSISQAINETNPELVVESTESEEVEEDNGWNKFTSKVKDSISNIGDNVQKSIEKGKKTLSKFIDAIAVLLITSCVIPIIVLLSLIWIVKIIFGINLPTDKFKRSKSETINKKD